MEVRQARLAQGQHQAVGPGEERGGLHQIKLG
jgi:hypothetical protein